MSLSPQAIPHRRWPARRSTMKMAERRWRRFPLGPMSGANAHEPRKAGLSTAPVNDSRRVAGTSGSPQTPNSVHWRLSVWLSDLRRHSPKKPANQSWKSVRRVERRRLHMFERVLVTLDGSRLSEAVLAEEPHATTVRPQDEPLTVGVLAPGAVVKVKAAPTAETKAQAIGRITDELRDFLIAEAVPFDRVGIRYHTAVRFGEPGEQIVRYAQKEKVDLIMMATHGHTGLLRPVFGSVASRIVASGVCPVMLVRPDGLRPD